MENQKTKNIIKKILKYFNKEDLPVLYNINFGHAVPITTLPIGTNVEVDFDNKKITLVESPIDK